MESDDGVSPLSLSWSTTKISQHVSIYKDTTIIWWLYYIRKQIKQSKIYTAGSAVDSLLFSWVLMFVFVFFCPPFGLWQVETVGDKYMAVSGLPEPCRDQALCIARLALDMMDLSMDVSVDGIPVVTNTYYVPATPFSYLESGLFHYSFQTEKCDPRRYFELPFRAQSQSVSRRLNSKLIIIIIICQYV